MPTRHSLCVPNCHSQVETARHRTRRRRAVLCKDTDHDAPLNSRGKIRLLGMMVLPRDEDHDYADVPTMKTLSLHIEEHDYLDVPNDRTLSLYVENIAEHLAGYVARMLHKDETCPGCLAILQERRRTGDPPMPSSSVVAICKSAEKCLKVLEARDSTSKGVVKRRRLETAVGCAVLHDLLERQVRFFEGNKHMFDTEPADNHVARLTKRTVSCYSKIRLHHQARSTASA
uniref:Putative p-element n=1 Tax=Ixodes ricinus TaxID=34613 RepID=A0A0K8R8G8_IXORI